MALRKREVGHHGVVKRGPLQLLRPVLVRTSDDGLPLHVQQMMQRVSHREHRIVSVRLYGHARIEACIL